MSFDPFDERLYTAKLTETVQSDYGTAITGKGDIEAQISDASHEMINKMQEFVSSGQKEYSTAADHRKRELDYVLPIVRYFLSIYFDQRNVGEEDWQFSEPSK